MEPVVRKIHSYGPEPGYVKRLPASRHSPYLRSSLVGVEASSDTGPTSAYEVTWDCEPTVPS